MTRRLFLGFVVAVVVFGWSAPAQAQETTTVRFYIVPKAGTGTHPDPFRPKYIADDPAEFPGGSGRIAGSASAMDYGFEPIFFVAANVTAAEDTTISAQPDVLAVPAGNLDNLPTTLGLSTLKTNLEALKIPSGWINTTHSYRDIVRFVTQLFQVFQRYHKLATDIGLSGTPFTGGITLDSTFGQLSPSQRSVLQQVAVDLGISTAGITNGTTLRQAFRLLGPQLAAVTLEGVPI